MHTYYNTIGNNQNYQNKQSNQQYLKVKGDDRFLEDKFVITEQYTKISKSYLEVDGEIKSITIDRLQWEINELKEQIKNLTAELCLNKKRKNNVEDTNELDSNKKIKRMTFEY